MFFIDAASAIKWAETTAARSNVKSQIGSLLKKGGGGDEVWDIALTISSRVAQCAPGQVALALKCIYGGPDLNRDTVLGAMIGDYLIRRRLDQNKAIDQLNRLGLATVKAERALTVYGDSYPVKRMAHDVGVSREQFSKAPGWLEVRAEATELLRNWLERGIREMDEFLAEHHWLTEAEVV